MSEHHINNDKTAVVSDEYYWQPMSTCPLALRVLLLGQGGVATVSHWNGKEAFWRGWAPLPKVRKQTP